MLVFANYEKVEGSLLTSRSQIADTYQFNHLTRTFSLYEAVSHVHFMDPIRIHFYTSYSTFNYTRVKGPRLYQDSRWVEKKIGGIQAHGTRNPDFTPKKKHVAAPGLCLCHNISQFISHLISHHTRSPKMTQHDNLQCTNWISPHPPTFPPIDLINMYPTYLSQSSVNPDRTDKASTRLPGKARVSISLTNQCNPISW